MKREEIIMLPAYYKYMTMSTGKTVLKNRTLRYSNPKLFNDPYDMQFDLQVRIDREKTKKIFREKLLESYRNKNSADKMGSFEFFVVSLLQKAPDRIEEVLGELELAIEEAIDVVYRENKKAQQEANEIYRKSKLCCFTTVPDSALMWAHYAEEHQGVVLEFRNIIKLDSPYATARPVIYSKKLPKLLNEEDFVDLLLFRSNFPQDFHLKKIYTKSKEWEYENEWRIFTGDGRNPMVESEDIPFHVEELTGVILGCRVSNEKENEIIDILEEHYPLTKLFKSVKNQIEFKYEIIPLKKL